MKRFNVMYLYTSVVNNNSRRTETNQQDFYFYCIERQLFVFAMAINNNKYRRKKVQKPFPNN